MKALLVAAAMMGVSTLAMAEQGDHEMTTPMPQASTQQQTPMPDTGYGPVSQGTVQSGKPDTAHMTPKTGIPSFDDIYHGS